MKPDAEAPLRSRVLIVEDDGAIADLIALYLWNDGLTTESVDTAEAATARLGMTRFDLIVLDINLPGMDGFEFLQKLRRTSTMPVIIVSAREADEDKVLGLGLGADDFVSKPFSPRVLAARVRAQLRRAGYDADMVPPPSSAVVFGPYTLRLDERYLEKSGRRVSLSRKEFELLAYLIDKAPAASTPDDIYRDVWGSEYGDVTTVAVHVRRLRLKLEADPTEPRWIVTEHGFGYRFDRTGDSPSD